MQNAKVKMKSHRMRLGGDEHLLNGPGLWAASLQGGDVRWGIVREVIARRRLDRCHRPARPCHRLSPSAMICRALSDFEEVFAGIGPGPSCRRQREYGKDASVGVEVRVGGGVRVHRLRARLWIGNGRLGPLEGLSPSATSCVGRH